MLPENETRLALPITTTSSSPDSVKFVDNEDVRPSSSSTNCTTATTTSSTDSTVNRLIDDQDDESPVITAYYPETNRFALPPSPSMTPPIVLSEERRHQMSDTSEGDPVRVEEEEDCNHLSATTIEDDEAESSALMSPPEEELVIEEEKLDELTLLPIASITPAKVVLATTTATSPLVNRLGRSSLRVNRYSPYAKTNPSRPSAPGRPCLPQSTSSSSSSATSSAASCDTKSRTQKQLHIDTSLANRQSALPHPDFLAQRTEFLARRQRHAQQIVAAIKAGNFDALVAILQRSRPDLNVFIDGQTALHYCLLLDRDVSWLQQLVSYGANANLANRDGWHPFHLAAFRGRTDTLAYLISCNRIETTNDHSHQNKAAAAAALPLTSASSASSPSRYLDSPRRSV